MAERIYQLLLRLFPAKHRQAFEEEMLQHARDLNRDAQQQGGLNVAKLCMSLVKDGIVNACREHWEGTMVKNNGIKPAPWLSVMLAALPGVLILLTRRITAQQIPLGPILWYLYLGLLLIVVPIIWWQKKRFPVWALLPLGTLVWFLIYMAGTGLSGLAKSLNSFMLVRAGEQAGIALLNVVVITVIGAAVLRGQRLPRSAWILGGIMVVGNLMLAILYSRVEFGSEGLIRGVVQYFTTSGVGPLEGLMLVALGSLLAREHGVLAILVVVGGYSYMFADSDYLFGYPQREWTWLATYFAAITILYLVVVPIALLRAKTRPSRALAVFVPLVTFHILRLTVPLLVIQEPVRMLPGDVVATVNIVLSFVLAWVLYSEIGESRQVSQASSKLAIESLVN
ncbi:MAG: hypothetical protein MUO67_15010 [Anaerolineales bacterium]|nr:hypothetical protein [Anaerolineales bacterium]